MDGGEPPGECCDVCGVRAHDAAASCGQRRPLSRTPRERGLCARRGTGLPAEGGAAGERRAGSVPSSWGALETPRGRARWLGTDRCRVLSSLRTRFVCDEISSNLTARPGRNFAARNLYDNEPTCGLPSLKKIPPRGCGGAGSVLHEKRPGLPAPPRNGDGPAAGVTRMLLSPPTQGRRRRKGFTRMYEYA